MLDTSIDQLIAAIQSSHACPDPLLSRELSHRFELVSRHVALLPEDVRGIVEHITWDLLPADWPLWIELAREDERPIH